MSEPTPSLKDAIEKLMGLYLAPSRFREPIKSAIEAHNSELDETITMLKALEAQSLEGLRAKIKARKRGWEAIQREDEPKNDIILDNVDEAIITEYETILRLFDAKPTENTPT